MSSSLIKKTRSFLNKPLIIGSLLLTAAGFVSRFIGFFYRIFLSHHFGEEGMGIYQLIAPVLALVFSITASGMQTAISRMIAANKELHSKETEQSIMFSGLSFSLLLSFGCLGIIYIGSDWIASFLLFESRTAPLLKVLALSFPFCTLHSAVNGYSYGKKKAMFPAISQLFEQTLRVGSVFLTSYFCKEQQLPFTLTHAVWGLVYGEIGASVLSLIYLNSKHLLFSHTKRSTCYSKLLSMSIPLSTNRIFLNLLQSLEAVGIPICLCRYGMDQSSSLKIYGVLTGMALPILFFPSALTNSISVMLLPEVSEAQAENDATHLEKLFSGTIHFCLLLGILFSGIFFFYGNTMGNLIYHSQLAGSYIVSLAWLCPFLYLATSLGSILNGLGKMHLHFIHNVISIGIRICFLFFLIPTIGIAGYLTGLVLSQFIETFLHLFSIKRYISLRFQMTRSILLPLAIFLICRLIVHILFAQVNIIIFSFFPDWFTLLSECLVLSISYFVLNFLLTSTHFSI